MIDVAGLTASELKVAMDSFEFAFSLFSLLLGMSLVEVLAGFTRTMQARKDVRLGWLTPMLGVFVMLHLTSFWTDAWDVRDKIPTTDGAFFIGLGFSSVYYYAASLIFPKDPDNYPDLDVLFFKHKKVVPGGVSLCDKPA